MVDIFHKLVTDEISGKKKERNDKGEVFATTGTWKARAKFHGLNRKDGVDIRRGINFRLLACLNQPAGCPSVRCLNPPIVPDDRIE